MKTDNVNSLKILHIVQTYNISGRSKIIAALNDNLNAQGMYSSIAVLSNEIDYAERQKQKVYCLNKREGIDLRIVFNLVKIVNRLGISIIQTHGMGALYYGLLAKVMSKAKKHVHVTHIIGENHCLRDSFIAWFIHHNLDCVVGVSESALSNFEENIGSDIRMKAVIYNGVDLTRFTSPVKANSAKEEIVIGTVANLASHKDHETLIRAFGLLAERTTNARLVIVGDGPKSDELKRLTAQLGLSSKINFLGFQENVPQILKNLDIFVLSTKREGFGVVILEAMASEIPVVASDIGPTREIITHDENGMLFSVGNYKKLSDILSALINNAVLRNRLITAGLKTVRGRFTEKNMVDSYISLYKQVAGL